MKSRSIRIILPLLLALTFSTQALGARLIGMNDDNGEFYEINPVNGSATFLGQDTLASVSLSGLAYDTANDLLWVSDTCGASCYGIGWVDLETWQITEIGGFTNTSNIHSIAYDTSRDILFGWDTEADQLVSISRTTGNETYLGSSGGPGIVGLTYDPVGDRLLGVSRDDETLYEVDPVTYAVTSVGALGEDPGTQFGLAWDPDTDRLYLSSGSGPFYEVNPATGAATLLGDNGELIGALAFIPGAVSTVPVPVSNGIWLLISMLLLGGLGLRAIRQRSV